MMPALIGCVPNDSGKWHKKETCTQKYASFCTDGSKNNLLCKSFPYPGDTILPCHFWEPIFSCLLSAMNRFWEHYVVSWNMLFCLTQWICSIISYLTLELLALLHQLLNLPQESYLPAIWLLSLTSMPCPSFLVSYLIMTLNDSVNIPVCF